MSTTDYRALCAELTNELSGYKMANPMHDRFLLNRARAALAEPVPPADGEMAELLENLRLEAMEDDTRDHTVWLTADQMRRVADILERLAPQPVPVSERMPVLEDRDHYGQCWWWGTSHTHRPAWVYASGWGTHWLPASTKYLPARVGGASNAEIAQPEPPANEEVARMVAWLRRQDGGIARRAAYSRIADLLERLAPQPDGPAVLEGREPASVMEEPSDEEIKDWASASDEVPPEYLDPDSGRWERCFSSEEFCATVRAALAQWGQP